MSYKTLTESLAQRWLAGIPPFGQMLKATGRTYNGCPIFEVEYRWLNDGTTVLVYRYTPVNSESSYLAFVPE